MYGCNTLIPVLDRIVAGYNVSRSVVQHLLRELRILRLESSEAIGHSQYTENTRVSETVTASQYVVCSHSTGPVATDALFACASFDTSAGQTRAARSSPVTGIRDSCAAPLRRCSHLVERSVSESAPVCS